MVALVNIDPQAWVDAFSVFVSNLPFGVHIFVAFAAVLGIRWAVVPLVRALRGKD